MFTGTAASYQETQIQNDGFWPDIDAGAFERRRSTPAAQDDERIAYAVANAMASVNLELERLKARYMAEGIVKAADIEAFPAINGKNRVVIQYEAAVFARAKADLLPDFVTVHQKKESDHQTERNIETKNELLAESVRILRNMLGHNRSTVDLL
ncbi:head completion/stabilization protein [Photobacterium halotolerans]|uniref:head completion/stabilization protein n=1 Tax=Photobacterium halotolerans TaxID=265726 RepID=UPI001373384F|nr:head completion/stabilization protein [Photobacterium halotolerans]NAW86310.1 head completion/stabilization protein [Photobacterium halotolerans]